MADYLPGGMVVGGRYRIEALIGEGGMAAVYSVRHAQLNTQHALKVLTMQSRSVQRRLMQEGRVQAAIKHPNILSVTDVVDVDGAPGLVMEFVRGPALDDFLLKKRLTVEQMDSLAAPILDGVAAAHGLGLIHRDLKPANVMLSITPSGLLPKVADFGLVKLLSEGGAEFSKTRSGMAMGTPAYMAPEQIRDAKTVDARADIWSLGAIIYEMASGRRAFDGEGDLLEIFNRVASGEYPSLREASPDLPERVYAAVEAAMTTDREQRIATVLELKALYLGEEARDNVWSDDLVSAAESMGGRDETSAFLQQSFRSQVGYTAPKASEMPTALREANEAETFYPDSPTIEPSSHTNPTLDHESVGRAADLSLSPDTVRIGGAAVAPASLVRPAAGSERRRMGLALIAFGLVAGLTSLLGLGYLYSLQNAVIADVPPVEVVAVEPVGTTAFIDPRAGTADPEPLPVPEVIVAAPAPAPVAPKPAEPAPVVLAEPAGTTDPEPVVAAVPDPEPQGTADPEVLSVNVDSDVSVFLIDGKGRRADLKNLVPGTYKISAVFDAANPDEVTELESVTLTAGSSVKIKCLGSRRLCKVTQ